jgi:hypothetical protein
MSIFARLRLEIKRERVEISAVEEDVQQKKQNDESGVHEG